ncbi:DUF262 domain-containing protein [Sphingobacterium sp. 2149]|uniref:DUF262 domain-containing protein n=1 Tax=Sphingobacterium sp. 2149 TaxID=2817763 RepID=UPI0028638A6C|nr:DUF262 domain-containing protein [Sphingobacterium sp. 2149]MDR6733478.1 hypothetical protein [Sphingobacterium sp. 2149]
MKIIRNTIPIADIYQKLSSGELTINRNYQRSAGLWPDNARSYFLDTIINEFPFPKIIIRQSVDLRTRKTKREIIDGQQRLLTIRDFIDNKIKLSKVSKNFSLHYFNDLPEDIQNRFLAYEISSDNVLSASEEEVLEIFRRINSYTLPLSKTEQRHATYQGEFKWFISSMAEYFTPFFEKHKTLSVREISRMEDADLITEIVNVIINGVQARSAGKLDTLYKTFDQEFVNKTNIEGILIETLDYIKFNFSDLFQDFNVRSYNFYSLFLALVFNKYGFSTEGNEILEAYESTGKYVENTFETIKELNVAFTELEEGITTGQYANFVEASSSTTHGKKQRSIRISTFIQIFRAL